MTTFSFGYCSCIYLNTTVDTEIDIWSSWLEARFKMVAGYGLAAPAFQTAPLMNTSRTASFHVLIFPLIPHIPLSFPGSIEIFPSSITIPKYSTFVLLNLHLVGFRNKSWSCNRARTFFVFYEFFFIRKKLILYQPGLQPFFSFIDSLIH